MYLVLYKIIVIMLLLKLKFEIYENILFYQLKILLINYKLNYCIII